ncbi:hypothetical protein EDD11_001317 [Mortierella claussenii]|nr:hypothetical protein EDD11_001317 [Mortierella claussenii]
MPSNVYFETGTHHVLCKIPGLDPLEFPYPQTFQSVWDTDHVRLPCSAPSTSRWAEVVQGLTTTITSSQHLSRVMDPWKKMEKELEGWNTLALEAFLDQKADRSNDCDDVRRSMSSSTLAQRLQSGYESPMRDISSLALNSDDDEDEDEEAALRDTSFEVDDPLESQTPPFISLDSLELEEADFLTKEERDRFFSTILPKMQALALQLPELVKKPIPLLKQQEDSAITLSQEQVRKDKHIRDDESAKHRESEGRTLNEEPKDPYSNGSRPTPSRGPKTNPLKNEQGQTSLFAYFGKKDPMPSNISTARKVTKEKPSIVIPLDSESIADTRQERSKKQSEPEHREVRPKERETEDVFLQYPSINFWSLFNSDDGKRTCTPVNAAKLRCIIHYFDRVTAKMPQGAVTYHRQVLKKAVSLEQDERISKETFRYVNVRVDTESPLEDDAPPNALQLDFANKIIGGGVLGHGAVQEEIRFMICPELIISRLFTQQLKENEAVLIKGAERFSNYNGYASTFTWHSDCVDTTPRDKLGRRKTEICAIDALPFKSRDQRLRQFSKSNILREVNKALVGFRRSPMTGSEWGLCCAENPETTLPLIATGNWGCGAFGGHLELKFLIQLLAASICGGYSRDDEDMSMGRDMVYYTYGLDDLTTDIDSFMSHLLSRSSAIEPSLMLEIILQYPTRSTRGNIVGLRDQSLLDYVGVALGFPSTADHLATFSSTQGVDPSLTPTLSLSPYF